MKILINVNTKQNFNRKDYLGGVEILNYDLFNHLNKKNEVILTNTINKNIKSIKWDIVISSNDSKIFNIINTKRKILWLHNKLQIEKAFRKKQLFSLFSNKIEAVFVSKYLESKTSKLYNFKKRLVIPNFLPSIFNTQKNSANNKKKIKKLVWSVQRDRGLSDLLSIWRSKIIPLFSNAELHIFSINPKKKIKYKKNNIFFHRRVKRKKLINFYKKSTGMVCLGYDETFCLNAIESMRMGLPVISLCETALKEIIKHNKNGYVVNSIRNIDKSIIKLFNLSDIKLDRLRRSSIAFAKQYNSKIIFKKWDKLINN
ncbi:glycosyltransferase [Candidatus Pelagibacter sp.]|nr:glycosyltransferase [Candidatus Pelagibacter sp.]